MKYLFTLISFAVCALAQSSLTPIEDTVHTTSGALFNGTVAITWTGSLNTSGNGPFSTSVHVANGVLSVQLYPSTTITPVAYYQAVYNTSDGLTTWTETWAVPPSTTAVSLSQIRVTSAAVSGGTTVTSGSQVQISQVVGLSSDLTAINSSLSTTNSTVQGLNSLIGNLSTTVTNLGSTVNTLSSGISSANFVDDETPSGTINGTNATFMLANAPISSSSVSLFRNGILQRSGADYTLSGQTITFSSGDAPQTGDELLAYYRITGTGSAYTFVDDEIPSGTVNGTNMAFSLANSPAPATSLKLFKNGTLLELNVDYTLINQTITFKSTAVTPTTGDSLIAYYRITSPTPSISLSRDVSAPARQDH